MTPSPAKIALTRRILLEDFRIPVSIGIHDYERNGPQPILINVMLEFGEDWVDPGDRIEQALDYDFLRDGIVALVAGRHFNLQETLGEEILKLCLARPGLKRVKVWSRKPDVYPDCKSIGFEIEAVIGR